jgi:hypothetical protein
MTKADLVTTVAQEAALAKRPRCDASSWSRCRLRSTEASASPWSAWARLPYGCVQPTQGVTHAPAKRWSWWLARSPYSGPVTGGERR